ncbi:MAG TPA: hypothetical protein VGA31_12985 [Thermoanaerobaculia bacterium]
MLSRLAQAVESLFGGGLRPAALFLRALTEAALIVAVTWLLVRAAWSLSAYRHGWETATVVRCPRCRRLVADPDVRACPAGHPIRFPPGSAEREKVRRRFHSVRRAAASSGVLVPLSLALLAVAGFQTIGVTRLENPLASLTASIAYLFFAAALALAGLAMAPRGRYWSERLLEASTALLCLAPALVLGLLSRGFEPPRPRAIGNVWSTPTALYVSTGGRARRVGEAAPEIEAQLVDARLPAFGIVWEGVSGFRAGTRTIPWRGRGGMLARVLDRWSEPLERRGVFLQRATRSVPLPVNVRIWIISTPEGIRFSAKRDLALAPPAPRSADPLRRTG